MTAQPTGQEAEDLLEQNRKRALQTTLCKMQRYEARYEMPSSSVEAEMNAGRLRETAEICDWVIAYHRYILLQNGH